MKASLYMVYSEEGWNPFWSISLDVDIGFWRDKGMVGWNDPLPLGIAEMTCHLLVQKPELRGQTLTFLEAAEVLTGAVQEVNLKGYEAGISGVWMLNGDESANLSLVSLLRSDLDTDILVNMAQRIGEKLRGRALLSAEVDAVLEDMHLDYGSEKIISAIQLASLLGLVKLTAAVGIMESKEGYSRSRWNSFQFWKEHKPVIACRRCGTEEKHGLRRSPCASCGLLCAYCEKCLTMGRTRECGLLVLGVHEGSRVHSPRSQTDIPAVNSLNIEHWKLSPAQTEAAGEALRFIRHTVEETSPRDRTFLLWAVTGAGKTEMIFPLIEEVVRSGGRVVVATPRKDVVLELAPRLAAAFPRTSLSVLHGGSPDRFGGGSITLATTHQLLRCHEAFDLVLIDELDAYPYHNNPMLQYAAAKSRKSGGVTVLLSATPPLELQRQAARGRLPHAKVPVRYHLHPLPLPVRVAAKPLFVWTRKGAMPSRVLMRLKKSVDRGAQLFVFVPYIADVNGLVALLRDYALQLGLLPEVVEGTSSKDPSRGDKVNSFRSRSIRILVTTTILERGVTVPKSDVFVFSADNPQFDSAALVQMAGRSGRSIDDPNGFVYFIGKEFTLSQRDAIRQISTMNRIAAKKGYLKRQGEEK
ncbi:DEAD/DEAH box helicase [Cohnella sp.]|uniref:DEAD/DEAH box helicase n=1 Tax=Cohnella sp. TaxID=1883426 RepID=UPI0035660607